MPAPHGESKLRAKTGKQGTIAHMTAPEVRTVSVLGAECSGKTTLAMELAQTLPALYVPESLRAFVDRTGRTPTRREQSEVMTEQIESERRARQEAERQGYRWVSADPGTLMTAIYSIEYFADRSLLSTAAHHQGFYDLTLWCDIDIGWEADGTQRDGPGHRRSVHELIGTVVDDYGLSVVRVSGSPTERLETALAAALAVGRLA